MLSFEVRLISLNLRARTVFQKFRNNPDNSVYWFASKIKLEKCRLVHLKLSAKFNKLNLDLKGNRIYEETQKSFYCSYFDYFSPPNVNKSNTIKIYNKSFFLIKFSLINP